MHGLGRVRDLAKDFTQHVGIPPSRSLISMMFLSLSRDFPLANFSGYSSQKDEKFATGILDALHSPVNDFPQFWNYEEETHSFPESTYFSFFSMSWGSLLISDSIVVICKRSSSATAYLAN